MLTLSRKQMTVLFLILVSFIVALVASMAVLHSTNPELWDKVLKLVPDVVNHY
jgi:H+/gluconate symporter-like permease